MGGGGGLYQDMQPFILSLLKNTAFKPQGKMQSKFSCLWVRVGSENRSRQSSLMVVPITQRKGKQAVVIVKHLYLKPGIC